MNLTDPDKIVHSKGGLAVAAFAALLAVLLGFVLGLSPYAAIILSSTTCAALAIEGYQWQMNRTLGVEVHDVSAWDVVATIWPGAAVAALVELAVRHKATILGLLAA